ncbi:hypothetical protein FRC11_002241, partial [Ceratobasidium sp. 423]
MTEMLENKIGPESEQGGGGEGDDAQGVTDAQGETDEQEDNPSKTDITDQTRSEAGWGSTPHATPVPASHVPALSHAGMVPSTSRASNVPSGSYASSVASTSYASP